jgi:hypothetical protein
MSLHGGAAPEPAHARMFAQMMQGAAPPSAGASGPGALHEAAASVASHLGGGQGSFDEIRRSMLASVDLRDPVLTMMSLTDHSMQAHALFARLHIATGLAGAAASLFGGLLKNQG